MRKKMFSFKNFVMLFMAIGLLTSVGCSKQDNSNEEIDNLKKEVATLKADLLKDFETKINAKTKDLQGQLDQAKSKLDELSKKKGVTPEELKNAIDEVKTKTVTNEAFEEYKNSVKSKIENAASSEDLTALETKIKEGFESRFSALETLAGKNEQGLKDALKKLEDEYASNASVADAVKKAVEELETKIGAAKKDLEEMLKEYATKASVDANTTEITKLNNKFDDFVEKNNLGVEVASFLNARLTSLVLLPEYVSDDGGALPLIYFTSLYTPCNSGSIVPTVEVRYVVSPSSVTASDIDTDNIAFKYNDPKVMSRSSNNPKPEAKFKSLVDGILTVEATIDVDKLSSAISPTTSGDARIDQLMLQVPVKGQDNVVVSSDWAKVKYASKEAAIARKPKEGAVEAKYILPSTLPGAMALQVATVSPTATASSTTTDQDVRVVEMAWDADLDLNEVIKSVYADDYKYLEDKYGLEFMYDLKDENGEEIVYNLGGNNTNQQQFIKLEGSTISTRVYDLNGNQASIGRTPIVHVMLKKGDCVVKHGFVKISIIEREIPEVPAIEFAREAKYQAKCGDAELYRVDTEEMNKEFYHKVEMSKVAFHKNYKFELIDEPNDVGTVTEVTDTNPRGETSYNLVYTLTEDEVWANVGKTVWKKAKYTYGTSVIEMTFKATIVKQEVELNVLLDNYWYDGSSQKKSKVTGVYNTVVHNVAVPKEGSEDPTTCVWRTNINNAFSQVSKEKGILNLGIDGYTYEYIFAPQTEQPDVIKKAKVKVTDDGKQLVDEAGDVIAKIEDHTGTATGTAVADDGDYLSYNENNELGKKLLNASEENMRAKLILVVKNSCGKKVDVKVKNLQDKDRFYVNFLRPVNVEKNPAKNFVDGVDEGAAGSVIDMRDIVKLSDWRNYIKGDENYHEYDFSPNHENYYKYYGVKSITVDLDAIKAKGLVVGGDTNEDKISDIPASVKIDQIEVDTANGKYGKLTYFNNSSNLGKEFRLVLPVTVEYKWGKIEKEVEVTVKPTSSSDTSRKAAK